MGDISELNRGSQQGPRQDIIRAFRGIGKSYITCAYVAWRLDAQTRETRRCWLFRHISEGEGLRQPAPEHPEDDASPEVPHGGPRTRGFPA